MFRAISLFHIIFFYTTLATAGCPAMEIRNGNADILSCSFSDDKPAGAVMDVNINYSNEMWMGEQSAKNMKAKIFLYSEDKSICKKYELRKKTYCMNLQQWCVMAGPAPHGVRFTVSSSGEGKCVESKIQNESPATQSKVGQP